MAYRVRAARAADITSLNAVQRATDNVHYAGILKHCMRLPVDAPDDLAAAARAGRLWVAAQAADHPVGYCFVRPIGSVPHIEEVSVHPDHGRRGLGRRLVDAAIAWARDNGHRRLTLTTFRELAWNGPFYATLGFAEVAGEDLAPAYRALLDEEAGELAPDPAYAGPLTRVLMACDLSADR